MPKRVLIAGLGLLTLVGCGDPELGAPGQGAPEISTLDLQDRAHRLADYSGKVLVLNFWSGGCGPCIAEMPQLESLYQQYRQDGLVILGINRGEEPDAVAGTARRVGVTYPIAIDQLGISAKRYGVFAVPATFVLDRAGVLHDRVMGEVSREQLESMVTPLLGVAEPAPAAPGNSAELAASAIAQGDAGAGAKMYRIQCMDCHGRELQDRAMGRSKPLREVSAAEAYKVLKRYQDRQPTTPDTVSKSGLSDQQIADLLTYVDGMQIQLQTAELGAGGD